MPNSIINKGVPIQLFIPNIGFILVEMVTFVIPSFSELLIVTRLDPTNNRKFARLHQGFSIIAKLL